MATTAPHAQNSGGKAVRRFIVFALLFILVTVAAIGLGGLIGRAIDAGALLVAGDNSGLATWLAFTLIAGPLAAILWWFAWRGLGERAERDSVLWGLYLAGMTTLALILWVSFLFSSLTELIVGRWNGESLANGVVWLAVWVWHRWMAHHEGKSPTRLAGGARILGYAFGVGIGSFGLLNLVSALVDATVGPATVVSLAGYPWWTAALQSGVWAAAGALVWWLHWVLDGGSRLRTGFATVMLALVTGLWAVGWTLSGIATAFYVVFRLAFERAIPLAEVLDPLGAALGAASVGALLWSYYRLKLRVASAGAKRGARLVSAGVALGATATGIGIVVNSILAAIVAPLAEADSRSLLFAGLSALLVGGPAWWLIWKPLTPASVELSRETGRRIYLIAVFGISALVAIITLLVIGYQVFEFLLGGGYGGSLLERVRATLGLLIATALVAGYHFSVWRRDRALLPADAAAAQSIGRVVLVTGANADEAVRAIRQATGAAVTVWTRTDETAPVPAAKLVAALDGVSGSRVLVVASAKGVQVIPLES